MYWAEHCVECAAPSCYQTCDLYQPRMDLRCRRFTFGAFKNDNFHSVRGCGVEISFKKWAKMEAYANLRLYPTKVVVLYENLAERVAPVANFFGKLMARFTRNLRWKAAAHVALESLVRRMDRRRSRDSAADAFLLEVYNPTDEIVRLQLSFSPMPAQNHSENPLVHLSQGLTETVVCPRGYSRHETSIALLRRLLDSGTPVLIQMIPEADSQGRLVFLTAEFVKFAARAEKSAPGKVKCVVFDLDNTLWKGVLVEGDDVVVQPEMMQLIKHLDERGVLLSIASKNERETALGKLKELGLSEYFLSSQINWNPKSSNLKVIADRLNIGIDSLAFVDDNPFELDEVTRAFPEVVCVNSARVSALFSDPRFQGSTTPDARNRRHLYSVAEAREAAQELFGSDYMGFLASCKITLEISPYSHEDSDRVAELVQRTNQLNFSGHKHTRQELEEIISNPLLEKYVLRSADRYGSYGTVGFCIVERVPGAICIRDFMLSCRVQGKLLERAFFHHLLEHHNPESLEQLRVNLRKTERNKPAQQVLESLGFRPGDVTSGGSSDGMECSSPESLRCDIVQVHCSFAPQRTISDVIRNPETGVGKHDHF